MINKKAKPTPADKRAADRLKSIWVAKLAEAKAQGRGWSQESAGSEMGMTQGAVSQYLNGDIPLGYGAVFKFANFLGIAPTEVRDDLDSLPSEVGEARANYRVSESSQSVSEQRDILSAVMRLVHHVRDLALEPITPEKEMELGQAALTVVMRVGARTILDGSGVAQAARQVAQEMRGQ